MDPPAGDTVTKEIPSLRYRDALAMVDWPRNASGFEKHAVYADGTTVHGAQPTFGHGMVMPGLVDNTSPWSQHMAPPDETGGRETQACYVVVTDCATHCARAKAAGAEIVLALETGDCGGSARDPEGHLWSFGDHGPCAEPAA